MNVCGIIVKAVAGVYEVDCGGERIECAAKGVFRHENITPLVGDRVNIDKETAVIAEVLERKNSFTRPPVANLDKLFIIVSTLDPVPNRFVIDKLITVCEYKEIEPIIVFTKIDLESAKELKSLYERAGFKTVAVNNLDGGDFSEIKDELRDAFSAFAGNSGVGKSSLLNNLFPDLQLATGEISKKLGRGKHTTRHVEIYKIDALNAMVADTPGFGTMEVSQYDLIKKENLAQCFREFEPYLYKCKFTGCSHTCEKGCAVLAAVESGDISKQRHESYTALYNEAKQIKEWENK